MATDGTPLNAQGWEAQYLRFVAFTIDPQINKPQDWWYRFVGTDSEKTTNKFQAEEKGPYKDYDLQLAADLIQISWLAFPRLDPANPYLMAPPTIGDYKEALGSFSELLRGWLPMCPPVKRI